MRRAVDSLVEQGGASGVTAGTFHCGKFAGLAAGLARFMRQNSGIFD
jgi:hypothetical protein